jgi:hypothetical protein
MVLSIKKNSANWDKILMQFAFLVFTIIFAGTYCGPTLKMIEQLQLFQFTAHYFTRFAEAPGGILMYAGKFLTQFFYWPWLGAVIIAFLLLEIQVLLNKLFPLPKSLWALSFIPSLLLLILQTGTGHLLGHSLGIFITLFLVLLYKGTGKNYRLISGSFLIVLSYFISGGHSLLVYVLFLMVDLNQKSSFRQIAFALSLRTALLVIVLLAGYCRIYSEFSIHRVLLGSLPDILIMPEAKQKWLFIFTYIFIGVIGFISLMNTEDLKKNQSSSYLFNGGLLLLLMILVARFSFSDKGLTVLLEIDQAVQEEKWDKVLDLARHYRNPERLVAYYTNVALCKSGRMADEMFAYDQSWGQNGLFIPFAKNPIVPIFGGEVYYQLGLVNYAYRWTYEGMVMHERSVRHLKRLYQIALINQEDELARKYRKTLSNGLFYDEWVKEMRRAPEIKQKRKLRPEKDFLIGSEFQFGALLRFAFSNNVYNKYLYNYMMAHFLLTKNLKLFVENLENYPQYNQGKDLPSHYQEALMIFAMQQGDKAVKRVSKFNISEGMREKLKEFNRMYQSARTSKAERRRLKQHFGDTYWYYYLLNRR